MEYSRFDDVASLLIDLCKPFNDDELINLMNIRISMNKDKNFEICYTSAVKSLYVKHFQEIKNNTYTKRQFTNINRSILRSIKNKTTEISSLPTYTKIDNAEMSRAITKLRSKLIKFHEK